MRRPAVYIIGAGPGDPGLITAHGLECLGRADVIVHDHRVDRRLLGHAHPEAEVIDVGTASTSVALAEEAIGYLLVEKAREGKLVARVKTGDPFVFDRGGEEALFLHAQGVPFEVVPGIPASIAVAAYAGVPLTYPGAGDTLTFIRGYEDEARLAPGIDWRSLGHLGGTLACHAGADQLPRILKALRANGWPADEQTAVIVGGTSPFQRTLSGTLAEVTATLHDRPLREAAILVVGRVVGLRDHLRWFDTRPLFGRRVLVTRPREQAHELSERLAALGAETVEAPMIRIEPPEDPAPLRRAAAMAGQFDWIVFASANAVAAFMAAVFDQGGDVRALKGPLLCTVGPGTAEKLAQYRIKVDVLPEEFRAEAVTAAMSAHGSLAGARVLLPRADVGRDVIADHLRSAGAVLTDVVAYRTVLQEAQPGQEPDVYAMLLKGQIDVVTFTSASAVRNFAKTHGEEQSADLLRNTIVATIGPVTAEAAERLGIQVSVQPATYTIPALVDAIAAHVAAAPAKPKT